MIEWPFDETTLGLLALDWARSPLVAVEQCDHDADQLAHPHDVKEQVEEGQRWKEDHDQPPDDPDGDKPAPVQACVRCVKRSRTHSFIR